MPNKKKIINDPVFGFITIPNDFIYDLIQHPFLYRLNRIKQLGLTSYVYPGAQHNRFQHSIGALFLMTEAIKTLRSKGQIISDEEADAVYAAILMHDIGHGPFSHTLEPFFFQNISHEDIGIAIIKKINEEFNGKLDLTIQILQNTYPKHYLHDLVSGQLDMDRLDYLRRDSFFTGVSEGNIGSARIIKMLNIKDDKLVIEAKGIYSIENFLMTRRLMYWQVYFHKTAFAAELMLTKIMQRAKYLVKNKQEIFCTPSLRYFLENDITEISSEAINQFFNLDDSDIWVCLKSWSNSNDKVLSILSENLLNRKVFKIKISKTGLDDEFINAKKAEIKAQLGLDDEQISYMYSYKKVSNNLYDDNDTSIDISFSNGKTKSILLASDMFNVETLAKSNAKYYFCYLRYE